MGTTLVVLLSYLPQPLLALTCARQLLGLNPWRGCRNVATGESANPWAWSKGAAQTREAGDGEGYTERSTISKDVFEMLAPGRPPAAYRHPLRGFTGTFWLTHLK